MARKGPAGSSKPPEENASPSQVRSASNTSQDRGNGSAEGQNENSTRAQIMNNFSSDEIAARAYQIYEREGRNDGRDMDHWLRAERELREERQRADGTPRAADRAFSEQNREQNRGTSGSRPQRPDEAPRSARRHQAANQPSI
jgi:hypothetical protein